MIQMKTTRMEKNVNNIADKKDWMIIPRLDEVQPTTYLDMKNIFYFDKTKQAKSEENKININVYEELKKIYKRLSLLEEEIKEEVEISSRLRFESEASYDSKEKSNLIKQKHLIK